MSERSQSPNLTWLLAVAVVGLGACDSRRSSQDWSRAARDAELPTDWKMKSLSAASIPVRSTNASIVISLRTEVLAWQILGDRRGQTFERCLVVQELQGAGESPRWALAIIGRQPPCERWTVTEKTGLVGAHGNVRRHCNWVPYCREYQTCPTNADIASFEKEFRWKDEHHEAWKPVDFRICANTWRTVIGEQPPRAL